MPYYVYKCDKGCAKEIFAKIGEAPDKVKCDTHDCWMPRSWKNLNISGKVQGGTNGGSQMGRK